MIKSKKFAGVYVYPLSGGDEAYYIKYLAQGRQIKEKVGRKSEGYSQAKASVVRGERVQDARHGKILPKRQMVPTFFMGYTECLRSKISVSVKRLHQIQGRYSKYIHSQFGNKRMTEIKPGTIRTLISTLENDGLMGSTIKQYLNIVSMVFDHMEMDNPVKKVKYHAEDRVRQRYLTKDEASRLVNFCEGDLKLQVQIMLLTGMRLSEVMNIYGRDVNFSENRIRVMGKGRNGVQKERFVEISTALEGLLWGKVYWNKYLFTEPFDRAAFNRAVKEAGLDTSEDRIWKVTPHTLRHTFGSWLGQRGFSPLIIQEAMGHSNIRTAMRYTKLGPRATQQAVNALEL